MENETKPKVIAVRFIGPDGGVVKPEVFATLSTVEKQELVSLLSHKLGLTP